MNDAPDIYMGVFLGQTRAAGWIRTLEAYGFGEMCCPGELPPRRLPWAFDNGAYKDWTRGRPVGMSDAAWFAQRGPLRAEEFSAKRYETALDTLHLVCDVRPRVVIVPDLVGGGLASLDFSRSWAERLKPYGPLYLALQDGITEADVAADLGPYAGVFVGGTMDWKLRTGEDWVRFAHGNGRKCHIGRVGTEDRVRWAVRIGADSIDSCLPLWSADNLRRFLRGFRPDLNVDLFFPGADG